MTSNVLAAVALATLMLNPAHSPAIIVQAPKASLRLEVADTQNKRETGMMFRRSVPAHTGMVFVFATDSIVGFWMKNTFVPLDMVFISSDGTVRVVYPSVPASTLQTPDSKVARRDGEAKFVFELASGEAARDGFVPGVHVGGLQGLRAR